MPDTSIPLLPLPPAASADLLTLAFAALLILNLLLRFWLASRQLRWVARHSGQVPAAFADTITLAGHQRAAGYTLAKTRLNLLETALSSALLLGWTLLGGLNWLNRAWLAALEPGLLQQLALLTSFVLIGGLIELPLSLYQTFVIEEHFGFNRLTWRLWLSDWLKSGALGALIGLPLAALVLWLMAVAGPWWWLWAWAVWIAFNLLLLLIYPIFLAPLFNRFEPLQDAALRERVTALMQRCGFAASGLFVMDGSRRSAHANAYFTGFGSSKRVVFFDTLLSRLTPDEVEAVLAHELGHFKHRHIVKRLFWGFVMSLAGLALLGWLSQQLWFYVGLGVQPDLLGGPNDALALLLLGMVLPLLLFFVAPLLMYFSRRDEFQADAYAVEHSSGAALTSALLKLYQDNASTLTPDPWFVAFHYAHPPASLRLARLPAMPSPLATPNGSAA